jgi:branched-chain amino acid transport system substrate-binding protein
MSSEDILQEIDTDMEMYSASMYNYHSPDALNQKFKENYISKTGEKPTIFSLMGYELGLGLLETMPALQKRDFKAVAETLKKIHIKSPRGIRNFYADDNYALPIIDIEKISIHNRVVNKIVVEQGRALRYDSAVYEEIHKEHVSGWQNPYLCV